MALEHLPHQPCTVSFKAKPSYVTRTEAYRPQAPLSTTLKSSRKSIALLDLGEDITLHIFFSLDIPSILVLRQVRHDHYHG